MTTKISGDTGIDVAQLRPADGDPVAMLIAADGKVTFPQNTQAWSAILGRAANTPYVNTTEQTIFVCAIIDTIGAPPITTTAKVNGVIADYVQSTVAAQQYAVTFPVPSGATYVVECPTEATLNSNTMYVMQ
jgi:hypothetical protein